MWTKSYGPNFTKCFSFYTKKKQKQKQKQVFCNHFWQRVDAILEDVSVAQIIFNAILLI